MPSRAERTIFMYNDDFEKRTADNENPNGTAPQNDAGTHNETEPIQGFFEESAADGQNAYTQGSESARSSENSYSYNEQPHTNGAEKFSDGVRYTNGSNGGVGYEWKPSENARKARKRAYGNKGVTGFKVFTTALLTVFVVSFAALTVMVAGYIHSSGDVSDGKLVSGTDNSGTSANVSAGSSDYAAVTAPSNKDSADLTIPQIAAKCSPSAVGIVVEVESTSSYDFGFGFSIPQSGTAKAVGSGFVLNKDGYIITNHHVVEDAKKITVVMSDKTEVEATLVGSDSISDIAVIKIDPEKAGVTLVPMEIGDSDKLVVGEEVVAIGCPAGIEYMGTVTNGIVSAINRDVEITDNYGRVQKTMTLIQTNATINKGNSGGPLINSKGQVIGINTLKLTSEYEGIGFSIPINGAMAIINQLIDYGEVVERTEEDFAYGSGMIGISGSAVSEAEAKQYGIPQGVLVFQIDKNSSAAKAGLRRGDIITKYNGTEVKTVNDINELKAKNRAGEEVTVTVYRDGEKDSDEGQTLDISFKLDTQQ